MYKQSGRFGSLVNRALTGAASSLGTSKGVVAGAGIGLAGALGTYLLSGLWDTKNENRFQRFLASLLVGTGLGFGSGYLINKYNKPKATPKETPKETPKALDPKVEKENEQDRRRSALARNPELADRYENARKDVEDKYKKGGYESGIAQKMEEAAATAQLDAEDKYKKAMDDYKNRFSATEQRVKAAMDALNNFRKSEPQRLEDEGLPHTSWNKEQESKLTEELKAAQRARGPLAKTKPKAPTDYRDTPLLRFMRARRDVDAAADALTPEELDLDREAEYFAQTGEDNH